MSEINDAATNIYNRLAAAPTFHPAGADLFTDWNLQSGDVVTVKSGNESYNVPIYNMRLHWAGDSKIEVESTGNPEREPLPAIKRREYASGSSTYSGMKTLGGGVGNALNQTAEINGTLYAAGLQIDPVTGVWLYASEHGADYALGSSFKVQSDAITAEVSRATAAEGTMSSRITQTADQIQAEVTARQNGEEVLGSRITQTATMIQTEVTNRQNADNQLSSRITQTDNNITLEVQRATAAEGNLSSSIQVNADSIQTKVEKNGVISAINQTAESITIQASKINLSGYTTASQFQAEQARLTNVITGQQRVTYLDALQLQADQSRLGTVTVERGLTYAGYGDLAGLIIKQFGAAVESSGVLTIPSTTLNNSAGPSFSFNITDTATYKAAAVSRVSVTLTGTPALDNTDHYTQSGTAVLTKQNGTTQSIGVSGILVDSAVSYGETQGKNSVTINKSAWSNGVCTFTKSSGTASTKNVSLSQGTTTWGTGNYANVAYITVLDGSADTGVPISVNAVSRYNAGRDSVTISSVAKDGTTTYSANYKTVYIPTTATASNGATKSNDVSSDITTAYDYAEGQGETTGWSNCYGTVRINNSSSGTGDATIQLGNGGQVSVYAQAKQNVNASVWTTLGTVTVKAPDYDIGSADITSNGTYWAYQMGYTYFSYVTVNVPTSQYTYTSVGYHDWYWNDGDGYVYYGEARLYKRD